MGRKVGVVYTLYIGNTTPICSTRAHGITLPNCKSNKCESF